jgi:uncharacterized protein (TIGR02246 family)
VVVDRKAQETVAALLRAGFDPGNIVVLHDQEDLHRLDVTGAEHGVLAQVQRTLFRALDLEQFKHLTHHVEDVQAGRFVIMVLAKLRAHRIAAADILHHFGAEFVGFYGRWAWEGLPAVPETSPELIPSLFARAWNARDADALASLFDEDAVFVNVSGLRWQDRESIRKAHAQRLADGASGSTLSVDDTTVKLIAPDVALVHARMMRSDGAGAAGAATQPGAETTIVSFVVHRAGNGWLCASAHNTAVVPREESARAPQAEIG